MTEGEKEILEAAQTRVEAYKDVSPEDRKWIEGASLQQKIDFAIQLIADTLDAVPQAPFSRTAIAWTGGKDSTLLLWLIRQACEKVELPTPECVFIDEGDVFEEVVEFCRDLIKQWDLTVDVAHNLDVSGKAEKIGDEINVTALDDYNQLELRRLGYTEETFNYEPESLIGNHLMKTVALNKWMLEKKKTLLFTGVRWDEQEARSHDDYIRTIQVPTLPRGETVAQLRIQPILHFTEKDVWDAIHQNKIPFVGLYKKGYRSLGAKSTTTKQDKRPAWEQDLENTVERSGRHQDKENIMTRLRELGYM